MAGRVLSWVTATAVGLFYRRHVLGASVPQGGPVLLVANHPNALLDPVLVAWVAKRPVRMLAKAPLFRMPVLGWLVRAMDSVPVYRSKDGADTRDNDTTFQAVEAALVAGDCVLIFPEGISHHLPSLQPLKTGAARMALRAVEAGAKDLVVVPVGLTYADKLRFRSDAFVQVGPPLDVAAVLAAASAASAASAGAPGEAPPPPDSRQQVQALTTAIADALRGVTLNVAAWTDVPLLEAVDAIWRQQEPHRPRRLQALADGIARLRHPDTPHAAQARLDALEQGLSRWVQRLSQLGLRPQDLSPEALQAKRNPGRILFFVARNLFALVALFPLAAWGALFWALPFWLTHLTWMLMRPGPDTGATVKVLAALLYFPLYAAAVAVAALEFLPLPWAITLLVVAPGAGMTTRHFFRRRFFAAKTALGVVRAALAGQVVQALLAERDAFTAEIDGLAALLEEHPAAPPG